MQDRKNYLIVGSGLTGCTIARVLKDSGFTVSVCEKENFTGGLCRSDVSSKGVIFEPFGARTFHTKNKEVENFVKKYSEFNSYKHHKGSLYKGVLYHYPINYETISKMPNRKQILKELSQRPDEIDRTNFETAMLSVFGKSLYKMFIKNYSEKFWGLEPKLLESEWAPSRVELKQKEVSLFESQWQGLPCGSYNKLFEKLLEGIPVHLNTDYSDIEEKFDKIIYTGKIDELYGFQEGILPYRSIDFEYRVDGDWENDSYGTINLPDHPKYFRKANFKILHQQDINTNYIQYQRAVKEDELHLPMYPINTILNNQLFDRYLKMACKNNKIIPAGRLGLYKYLDMDKAILLGIQMKSLILKWERLKPSARYNSLISLLDEI
jgi:UDP-galactopyranose mutase